MTKEEQAAPFMQRLKDVCRKYFPDVKGINFIDIEANENGEEFVTFELTYTVDIVVE